MSAYIEARRDRYGVEPICRALQVAPSTYCAHRGRSPSERALRDERLEREIARVHADNYGVYGADKVWAQLNREGLRITRSGRRTRLHLPARWPWAAELLAAFSRLRALPDPG